MDTLEHSYHNQHIYIRHEETNEINCIFRVLDSFPLLTPTVRVHSVFCVPFLARFPCVNKFKHQVIFVGYRECLLFKSFFDSTKTKPKRKKKIEKKRKIYVHQCDSPYPHHAVNIDLMAWLQGPLRTDKACSVKINQIGLGPCKNTVVKEDGRWSGNRTGKIKMTLC